MNIFKKIYKILLSEDIDFLKRRGLVVGKNLKMQRDCIIDKDHCFLITIGDNVTLAPRVHILAHDASTKIHLGYTKIGCVNIGNKVFIGAGSIILPNVTIGDNCIIGAGSVVTKSFEEGLLIAGNPAKVIGKTRDYIKKNKNLMEESLIYDESWTIRNKMSKKMKKEMKESLKDTIGYVE